MRDTDRRDATALLLLAGSIAAIAIAPVVARLDPSQALADLAGRIHLLALVALPVVGLLGLRVLATRRALRSRVRFAVVPADDFDPSLEAVMRFAAQLSRVRRSVRGWLDRRASAVRIRLEPDPDGRLAYSVEAPGRAREVLLAALRSYERLELSEVGRPADDPPALPEHETVRAELVLARASVEPLARLELDPDPLEAFAAALRDARAEAGERALVCVDLLPAGTGEVRRLRRRLLRQARRRGEGPRARMERRDRRGRAAPSELAERRAGAGALDRKLREPEPLLRLQVLVHCSSAERGHARRRLGALLSCFDQLAAENALRVSGLRIPGLCFLGSDLPLRRSLFDRRLRTGLFRPARAGIVTAREVALFLKPPTARCAAENVVQAGALASPPPPGLPGFAREERGLIPLGRVAAAGGERVVGVRVADTFFAYVAGRSRFGKTELALAQFLHLVRSGHGGLFLDPHADALARLRPHLTEPGVRERVVEIDLANPSPDGQPGWNLFDLAAATQAEAEARVDALVDALASALRWDERNTRALTLATQAASALAHLARRLEPELCPTIFQLPTLLSEERFREAAQPHLPQSTRRFFRERFPRLPDEAITPVTNLIDRLRASTPVACLLGQPTGGYRAREAMDHGQIVLACPGSGGTRDRLIANFLVFDLLHAARARAQAPAADRRLFFCFLDEVQTYDGASAGQLASLLEQTAKYGLRAVLLNQNPERLSAQTLGAIATNRSHLAVTALGASAARLVAREWAGGPEADAIARLPRFSFLCQVTHRGELSRPFRLRGVRLEQLYGEGRPDQLPALEAELASRRRPAAEVLTALDELDERILAALERRTPPCTRLPGGGGGSVPLTRRRTGRDGEAAPS
jgi:hypothetical protein